MLVLTAVLIMFHVHSDTSDTVSESRVMPSSDRELAQGWGIVTGQEVELIRTGGRPLSQHGMD